MWKKWRLLSGTCILNKRANMNHHIILDVWNTYLKRITNIHPYLMNSTSNYEFFFMRTTYVFDNFIIIITITITNLINRMRRDSWTRISKTIHHKYHYNDRIVNNVRNKFHFFGTFFLKAGENILSTNAKFKHNQLYWNTMSVYLTMYTHRWPP